MGLLSLRLTLVWQGLLLVCVVVAFLLLVGLRLLWIGILYKSVGG